jgi:hypothetical protein
MAAKSLLLCAISLWSCAVQTNSEAPPPVAAVRAPPPPPTPTPPPPPKVESTIEDDTYRTELLKEFRLRNRSRPIDERAYPEAGTAPSHEVHAFRRIGRGRTHLVLTVGLGRVPRESIDGEHVFVELFAESRNYGEPIAEVLSALGRALHDPELGRDFKPYASVRLETPQHNLQFFDLVPAGEIDVARDHRVILFKVVPVTAEEYEATKKGETQFAGRDDATPEAAERASMRWAPALAQGAAAP